MLHQQLTAEADLSGKLVVTAPAGELPALVSLAEELKLRPDVETDGSITVLPPADNPPIG